jgi:hypothetical protein
MTDILVTIGTGGRLFHTIYLKQGPKITLPEVVVNALHRDKALVERLALLLEDDPDKRSEISNHAVEILQTRGEVVHTGQPDDEKKLLEQLPLAFEYISGAIIKTAQLTKKHKFNKFSDFTSYLAELKVS